MKVPVPAIRFRPFSHVPGTHCLLPGSWLSCQIFPARICVSDQRSSLAIAQCSLERFGPVTQFTVQQDLEQGHIQVSGYCPHGYFRYQLLPCQHSNTCLIRFLKLPAPCTMQIQTKNMSKNIIVSKSTEFYFPEDVDTLTEPLEAHFSNNERLFLGCTKAQDWTLVTRRQEIREILPFWYKLAQMIPPIEKKESLPIIKVLETAVFQEKRQLLPDVLRSLFLASFKDLLLPRLFDDSYLGLENRAFPEGSNNLHSCSLQVLQESYPLIRQIFFLELPQHLYILPLLPPHFHSGMLANSHTTKGHRITIEWTKQSVRRMWLEAGCDDTTTLVFQKNIRHFRIRTDVAVKGSNFSEIILKKGVCYLFDHFES